jgi:hypothetical protein
MLSNHRLRPDDRAVSGKSIEDLVEWLGKCRGSNKTDQQGQGCYRRAIHGDPH